MKYKKTKRGDKHDSYYITLDRYDRINNDLAYFWPFDKLMFHSSWDWLMPVYKEIARVWGNMSSKKQGEVKEIRTALQNRLVLGEINGVWEFCVEFVQWYNSQSK